MKTIFAQGSQSLFLINFNKGDKLLEKHFFPSVSQKHL
jgi:hypothetical protein